MENNQQRNTQNEAAEYSTGHSYSNSRPSQQLPAGTEENRNDNTTETAKEQHSESSQPQRGNETLGTP